MFRLLLLITVLLAGVFSHLPARALNSFTPVVVELYTQQLCKKCIKSNKLMPHLRSNPNVLVLSFPIMNVGLVHEMSLANNTAMTQRLRTYSRHSNVIKGVQTPLFVVDGFEKQLDADQSDLDEKIYNAANRHDKVLLRMNRTRYGPNKGNVTVHVGELTANRSLRFWLVGFTPGLPQPQMKGYEAPPYLNVVQSLKALPVDWDGKPKSFTISKEDLPPTDSAAIIIQEATQGRIWGAAAVALR